MCSCEHLVDTYLSRKMDLLFLKLGEDEVGLLNGVEVEGTVSRVLTTETMNSVGRCLPSKALLNFDFVDGHRVTKHCTGGRYSDLIESVQEVVQKFVETQEARRCTGRPCHNMSAGGIDRGETKSSMGDLCSSGSTKLPDEVRSVKISLSVAL